ncbi:MAG: hypothetical protein J2P28_21270 [Actinobacteria bacterium]|nr:hypothetical protein [Candidatus Dormibacteraeota bacterium]MBO0838025.1 hypothetical protein [Actinomycetota bacterium]
MILPPSKLPLLLLLAAMIVTFVAIRVSVRMIRAQVRWWPGNVSTGGLHIHHVVFGVVLMAASGVAEFALGGISPWREVLAVCFGAGIALVLDEFALVLRLEDVYWAEEGRTSVTAAMLAIALVALVVLGASPLAVDTSGGTQARLWLTAAGTTLNAAMVAICLLKGKYALGLLGTILTPLAWVGAIRLARPRSPWARWRYPEHSRKMAAARRREERLEQVWIRRWHQAMDLVAGAPDREGPPPQA